MNAPPLVVRNPADAIARRGSQLISVGEFCGDIEALRHRLPAAAYLINLCQDRYSFTITFFAALANRQTTLLPAKREAIEARLLAEKYGDCALITDQTGESADLHIDLEPGANGESASPSCPSDHIAAIAFTSGSTGEPQAHAKSWGMLNAWRNEHFHYLPDAETPRGLVATVPSWHMYGLEWAMLLPTIAPLTTYYGSDFYPQDVMNAIATINQPTILVSTPVHLHALSRTTNPPDNVAAVLCATAPLDEALTDLVEQHFDTELFEIYGCSEIGSLAYRYPSRLSSWSFFDCFEVQFDEPRVTISHPELPEPVTLTDAFEKGDADGYQLLGRTTDIVKVGGKRESLANLNNILARIPGVEDGIVYQPESLGLPKTGRLAALVVAPSLNVPVIRSALARQIDSSFLPRPIRLVPELPRDRTSKLQQTELSKLAREESTIR
jgi:acyl-coenzyme A synthetase/AMP-(fatty) acid ligase